MSFGLDAVPGGCKLRSRASAGGMVMVAGKEFDNDDDDDDDDGGPGSPPCFAHELIDGHPVDPQTVRDVARFRKAERSRLIAARLAISADARALLANRISDQLDQRLTPGPGLRVALYWPFRGEPDLRGWMARAHAQGAQVALPVVVEKARPLIFRDWSPGCAMERGVWNILIPSGQAEVIPNVVIAPLVGVDDAGFRLGYGGGFYDRTLAGLAEKPLVIGVGDPSARLRTIFPQPHDIPMDLVVTGADAVFTPDGEPCA